MILEEKFTISNGVEIPKLDLGIWFISDDSVTQAVKEAIKIGYRAQAYQNEKGVGEGIRESAVDRDEVFVTTKLATEIKSYDEAVASIDESLERMGLETTHMMIIHSPKLWNKYQEEDSYFEGNREAWRAV